MPTPRRWPLPVDLCSETVYSVCTISDQYKVRTINKICISEYIPESDNFKASFCELIGAFSTSFREMGIPVDYRINEVHPEVPNLVFGCHRLIRDAVRRLKANALPRRTGWRQSAREVVKKLKGQLPVNSAVESELGSWMLPDNCIPMNLEPLNETASWLTHYRKFLGRSGLVVDYSQVNEGYILRDGEPTVHRFRYGYIPLSAFQLQCGSGEPAFFGYLTRRRKKILDRLRTNGVNVNIYNNHWGTHRDLLIGAAGAALNLSKHDDSILEVHRLWLSLCLGVPVISEKGIDAELEREWSEFVCFVDDVAKLRDWRNLDLIDTSLYRSRSCFQTETERLVEWIGNNM